VMLPPLSRQAQAVLDVSLELARRQGSRRWSPFDVLSALAGEGESPANGLLADLRVDVPVLRARLDGPVVAHDGSGDVGRFRVAAAEEAALTRAPEAGVEHLLLALCEIPTAERLLREAGITRSALHARVSGDSARFRRWQAPFSTYHNLATFGRDLTELARDGRLDPVIGREAEVHRVMQVLNRRMKNNPVLIGFAGVGKTAIVEGLAQRIAADHVPEQLRHRRIIALDVGALVAGTRARGQFEERLQGIIQDIERAAGELILFVDEVHTIVGAGASDGGFDFAGIIKPALARGTLPLIGATTPDEYRRYIERDAALERRLSPVWVAEPTVHHTIAILRGLRPRYESHHAIEIQDDALDAAARLSARYLSGRRLPDKAIDLIDEAAARLSLDRGTMPDGLADLDAQVTSLDAQQAGAGATDLQLRSEHRRRMLQWLDTAGRRPLLTEADVAALVAAMTGIPVARLVEGETDRLLRLEERLHRRVVGQDHAVAALSAAIRRARVGLGDARRPIGSFIFLGPSGVGKTELSRALAEVLFDDPDAILHLDMSEYMERHNVARLFGAPPGYVGYDDAGALTEQVRRRPYQVILFDEIEKAHPDVWNVLLQILDAGRMTDGHGRVVDFRNTVIIMTSNLGTGDERDAERLRRAPDGSYDRAWLEDQVAQALRTTFRPEFRNRVDEILVFEPLGASELDRIVELLLADLRAALGLRGLTLRLTRTARRALVAEGFSPVFGARPLRRTIQQRVITPLVERLLRNELEPGDGILVGHRGGHFTIRPQRTRADGLTDQAAAPFSDKGAIDGGPARPIPQQVAGRPAGGARQATPDDFAASLI
jgi:ATP-dependent Clp protease ATP-binding subunit ClpA